MKADTDYRFVKRLDGDDLSFYTADGKQLYLKFSLQALRDMVLNTNEFETALVLCRALESAVAFRLTPEEIEYAVEDI